MTIQRILRPFTNVVFNRRLIFPVRVSISKFSNQHAPQVSSTTSELEEFMSKHEILINGKNTELLKPIFSFDETNFPDSIKGALKQNYEAPTVIQSISWPAVLGGRDLVGIARTGSGKTLAFLLPALVHISQKTPIQRGDGPDVLILCPTRELAQQVQAVADEWSNVVTRVRTMCAFGGASRGPQEAKLMGGVEIVVATPGRLNDFLRCRTTNMKRCSYLVLDEADRMLDMGFEPQIREIIDRIENQRQTLMYSATWPKEVRQLASDFMKDYVHIKIGSAELSANKNITQIVHVTTNADKDRKFWELMQKLSAENPKGKMLVFCLQKMLCDRMEYLANQKKISAASIHGDKSQAMRDRVLRDFRTGRKRVLFATDVAARGLDVDNIEYVINYDHPLCAEDYVHRIGRTARGESKGESHTFVTEDNVGGGSKDLIAVLEASSQPVPDELRKLAESAFSKGTFRRWGNVGAFSVSYSGYGRGGGGRNQYSSYRERNLGRYDRDNYDDRRYGSSDRFSRNESFSSHRDRNVGRYESNDSYGDRKFSRYDNDRRFSTDSTDGYSKLNDGRGRTENRSGEWKYDDYSSDDDHRGSRGGRR